MDETFLYLKWIIPDIFPRCKFRELLLLQIMLQKASCIDLWAKINVSFLMSLFPFSCCYALPDTRCTLLFFTQIAHRHVTQILTTAFASRTSSCIISAGWIEKLLCCWNGGGSCCDTKSLYPPDTHTSSSVSVYLACRLCHFHWIAFNFQALAYTVTPNSELISSSS